MTARLPPPFAKESDLCAAFIAALPDAWTAYAETEGWDILLARGADGFQIGVQAKLKLNAKVLVQAAEGNHSSELGPDCRAVLVPETEVGELEALAPLCALTVIQMRSSSGDRWFSPHLPELGRRPYWSADSWHELCPLERYRLPEYVPDVVAGSAAPMQLTRWKIAAIRICILLEQTGYLTRADFKRQQIDIRRWMGGRWLQAAPQGLIAGPRLPDFRKQHPQVWEQALADVAKWRRDDGQQVATPTEVRRDADLFVGGPA